MDDMVRRALRYSTWLPRAEDEGVVWMAWLVRLRWVAIVAQITTLASVLSRFAETDQGAYHQSAPKQARRLTPHEQRALLAFIRRL